MPANRASLQITEAYRGKMVALRERAQHDAREVWGRIDQRDLDGTYEVGLLAVLVTAMQREAARLSSGYLQAFIQSELGRPIRAPMVDARQVGSARNGDELRKALVSPLITTKVAIRGGKTPAEALVNGRKALERMVGLATDTAARESLRRGMEDSPHVEGWRRAVRGTCGACMGASKGRVEDAGETLHIHPNCQCVSEPVIDAMKNRLPSQKVEDYMTERSQTLPDEAEGVLEEYQAEMGHWLNRHLRGLDISDMPDDLTIADLKRAADGLDDAFAAAGPAGRSAQLWRGIISSKATGLKPGYTMTDAAFGSTSARRAMAEEVAAMGSEGQVLELTVHPKVRAIWVNKAFRSPLFEHEKELLLERGCRYVVQSVEDGLVRAIVLPPA